METTMVLQQSQPAELGFGEMQLAGKINVSPGERLNQGQASQQCVH